MQRSERTARSAPVHPPKLEPVWRLGAVGGSWRLGACNLETGVAWIPPLELANLEVGDLEPLEASKLELATQPLTAAHWRDI